MTSSHFSHKEVPQVPVHTTHGGTKHNCGKRPRVLVPEHTGLRAAFRSFPRERAWPPGSGQTFTNLASLPEVTQQWKPTLSLKKHRLKVSHLITVPFCVYQKPQQPLTSQGRKNIPFPRSSKWKGLHSRSPSWRLTVHLSLRDPLAHNQTTPGLFSGTLFPSPPCQSMKLLLWLREGKWFH